MATNETQIMETQIVELLGTEHLPKDVISLKELLLQSSTESDQHSKLWLPIVIKNVCNLDKAIREAAAECLEIAESDESQKIARDLVVANVEQIKADMVKLLESGEGQHALGVWKSLALILKQELHTNRLLVNKMLLVLEQAFKSVTPVIQIAACNAWSGLITNFSLSKGVLTNSKRIKLLIQPLNRSRSSDEGVLLAKLNTWWYLAYKVDDALANEFDKICLPLLKNAFLAPKKTSSRIAASSLSTASITEVPQPEKVQRKGCEILLRVLEMPAGIGSPKKLPLISTEGLVTPLPNSVIVKYARDLLDYSTMSFDVLNNNSQTGHSQYLISLLLQRMGSVHRESTSQKEESKESVQALALFLQYIQKWLRGGQIPLNAAFKVIDDLTRSLPNKVFSSHCYHKVLHNADVMSGVPALDFITLILEDMFFSYAGSNPSCYASVFQRLVTAVVEDDLSCLPFTRTIFSLLAKKLESMVELTQGESEVFHNLWTGTSNALWNKIEETQDVNQGDNLEHDFSCLLSCLVLPFQHFASVPTFRPETEMKSFKTWENVCRSFFRFSALVESAEANCACEELCAKLITIVEAKQNMSLDGVFWEWLCQTLLVFLECADFQSVNATVAVQPQNTSLTKRKSQALGNIASFVALLGETLTSVLSRFEKTGAHTSLKMIKKLVGSDPLENCTKAVLDFFSYITNSAVLVYGLKELRPSLILLLTKFTTSSADPHLQMVEDLWLKLTNFIITRYQGKQGQEYFDLLYPLLEATLLHPHSPLVEKSRQLWLTSFSSNYRTITFPETFKAVLKKINPPLVPGYAISPDASVSSELTPSSEEPRVEDDNTPSNKRQHSFWQLTKKSPLPNVKKSQKSPMPNVKNAPKLPTTILENGNTPERKKAVDYTDDIVFVKIEPKKGKPKILTEHQKEKLKQKSFVPAMYNDLSQPTLLDGDSQLGSALNVPIITLDSVGNAVDSDKEVSQDQAVMAKVVDEIIYELGSGSEAMDTDFPVINLFKKPAKFSCLPESSPRVEFPKNTSSQQQEVSTSDAQNTTFDITAKDSLESSLRIDFPKDTSSQEGSTSDASSTLTWVSTAKYLDVDESGREGSTNDAMNTTFEENMDTSGHQDVPVEPTLVSHVPSLKTLVKTIQKCVVIGSPKSGDSSKNDSKDLVETTSNLETSSSIDGNITVIPETQLEPEATDGDAGLRMEPCTEKGPIKPQSEPSQRSKNDCKEALDTSLPITLTSTRSTKRELVFPETNRADPVTLQDESDDIVPSSQDSDLVMFRASKSKTGDWKIVTDPDPGSKPISKGPSRRGQKKKGRMNLGKGLKVTAQLIEQLKGECGKNLNVPEKTLVTSSELLTEINVPTSSSSLEVLSESKTAKVETETIELDSSSAPEEQGGSSSRLSEKLDSLVACQELPLMSKCFNDLPSTSESISTKKVKCGAKNPPRSISTRLQKLASIPALRSQNFSHLSKDGKINKKILLKNQKSKKKGTTQAAETLGSTVDNAAKSTADTTEGTLPSEVSTSLNADPTPIVLKIKISKKKKGLEGKETSTLETPNLNSVVPEPSSDTTKIFLPKPTEESSLSDRNSASKANLDKSVQPVIMRKKKSKRSTINTAILETTATISKSDDGVPEALSEMIKSFVPTDESPVTNRESNAELRSDHTSNKASETSDTVKAMDEQICPKTIDCEVDIKTIGEEDEPGKINSEVAPKSIDSEVGPKAVDEEITKSPEPAVISSPQSVPDVLDVTEVPKLQVTDGFEVLMELELGPPESKGSPLASELESPSKKKVDFITLHSPRSQLSHSKTLNGTANSEKSPVGEKRRSLPIAGVTASPLSRSQRMLQAAIKKAQVSPKGQKRKGTPNSPPFNTKHAYSPMASPSGSILKGKRLSQPLPAEKSPSPDSKKRRVSFADPPVEWAVEITSQKKHFPSDVTEEAATPGITSLSNTGWLMDSQLSNNVVNDLSEDPSDTQPSFEALHNCVHAVDSIIHLLTSTFWAKPMHNMLVEKGLLTIGDLSRMSTKEVMALPLTLPKIPTLQSALSDHLKKCSLIDNDSSEVTSSKTSEECSETKLEKPDLHEISKILRHADTEMKALESAKEFVPYLTSAELFDLLECITKTLKEKMTS